MKYLEYSEAIKRLGPALFHDEWVEALSAKERWILNETPSYGGWNAATSLRGQPSSVLPGAQNDFATRSSSAVTPEQYRAALERQQFMHHQWDKIASWLALRGLVVTEIGNEDFIDAALFEVAFAKAFPSSQKPQGLRSIPAVAAVKSRAGKITALVAAQGLQLTRGQFNAMLCAEFEADLAPNILNHAWQASPAEWRKEGNGRLPSNKTVKDWHVFLKPAGNTP